MGAMTRIYAWILLAIFVPSLSLAAVAIDTSNNFACGVATGDSACTSVGSLTYALTVGTGSNRALAVFVFSLADAGARVNLVTYANVNLIRITSQRLRDGVNDVFGEMWALPPGTQPTSGTNNVVITMDSNSNQIFSGAIAVTGVDQTTTFSSYSGNDNGPVGLTSSLSTTLSSSGANDLIIEAACTGGNFSGTTETSLYTDNVDGSNKCNNSAAATNAGGKATPLQFSGATDWFVMIAASFKAEASSTVAIDSSAHTYCEPCTQNTAIQQQIGINIAANPNRQIFVFTTISGNGTDVEPTVNSVRWANLDLVRIRQKTVSGVDMQVWAAPPGAYIPTGGDLVRISLTGNLVKGATNKSGSFHSGAFAVYGVNQTTPVTSSIDDAGTGTTASLTLPSSNAGDLTLSNVCAAKSISSTPQVQQWIDNISTSNLCDNGGSAFGSGGGTALSWTLSASTSWVMMGLSVNTDGNTYCSNPVGSQGSLTWNSTTNTAQYCNGTAWIETAQSIVGTCSTVQQGTYSSGIYQFCNGTNWISMQGASLGSCSPTPQGTITYDSGLNKVKFCDGSNWYDTTSSRKMCGPIYVTSGTTWVVKSDFNSSFNTIEVIGGGGAGGNGGATNGGAGGGGGGYTSVTNVTLTPSGTVALSVGAAGSGNGGNGGDTYFCNAKTNCGSITDTAVIVGAKGGTGGNLTTIGTGGNAAAAVPASPNAKYSGGNGNTFVATSKGGGGGGAAGRSGNGVTATGQPGGAGDNGLGGTGGNANGAGQVGQEYDGTHGSGGGGGGGASGGGGKAAGNYGAGGGGAGKSSTAPGAGKAGLVIIRYLGTTCP